jgi:ferrous iron transport protein B
MMTYPGLPDATVAQFEQQRLEAGAVRSVITQEIEKTTEETALSAAALQLRETLEGIDRQEAEARLRNSVAGRLGITLEQVSRWAGFDWRTNIALVGGFAAKEVIVSTLGTAYSLGEVDPEEIGSLPETLATSPGWSPVVALSLIVFVMFYAPCFVTVVCIARESGSWKWGAFSMIFNTIMAFALAVLVYQVGEIFL